MSGACERLRAHVRQVAAAAAATAVALRLEHAAAAQLVGSSRALLCGRAAADGPELAIATVLAEHKASDGALHAALARWERLAGPLEPLLVAAASVSGVGQALARLLAAAEAVMRVAASAAMIPGDNPEKQLQAPGARSPAPQQILDDWFKGALTHLIGPAVASDTQSEAAPQPFAGPPAPQPPSPPAGELGAEPVATTAPPLPAAAGAQALGGADLHPPDMAAGVSGGPRAQLPTAAQGEVLPLASPTGDAQGTASTEAAAPLVSATAEQHSATPASGPSGGAAEGAASGDVVSPHSTRTTALAADIQQHNIEPLRTPPKAPPAASSQRPPAAGGRARGAAGRGWVEGPAGTRRLRRGSGGATGSSGTVATGSAAGWGDRPRELGRSHLDRPHGAAQEAPAAAPPTAPAPSAPAPPRRPAVPERLRGLQWGEDVARWRREAEP